MFPFKFIQIRSYEKGLFFKNKEFQKILNPGRYWFFDPLHRIQVDVVSQRDPWLNHSQLDLIIKSNCLGTDAVVLDLKDNERALVWIDERFNTVLDSGQYVLWKTFSDIKTEIIDARNVFFDHEDFNIIIKSTGVEKVLNVLNVEEGHVSVFFKDGNYIQTLNPGLYASWMKIGKIKVYNVDMRERLLDVSGQEIMTADKVSLRINAIVAWQVLNARQSIEKVNDIDQALYREAQLALRAIVGTKELDTLLSDKHTVASELETSIRKRALEFGAQINSLGIRDIILPGDMKNLLNKVIEAQKASEANVILRREETAAMRSQMNTAKLMENNPALMRLKELEVLEKVAQSSKLNVVLGEKGLTDKVVNLI